jgi:uncharacterized protein
LKRIHIFLLLILSASAPSFAQSTRAQEAPKLKWIGWSDSVFTQAKQENKFVLLDLEAVWCHWCHVMAETTYKDPKVVALLRAKYLNVRVDQDSRPDLSNRYEDYGWPATVVFDGDAHEIIKRRGYLPPGQFASILQAVIDDPTPGPSVEPEVPIRFPVNPLLPASLRAKLTKYYFAGYDSKQGGWGDNQKFLDWDSVEYAMDLAADGNEQAAKMVRQTLTAELNLLDPAWGGVYQYSVGGVWTEPHFEKIMSHQSEDLRIYSLAYAQWHDPADLNAAESIHKFLTTFLQSPTGAFYASQDADLIDGKHSANYFKLDDQSRRKLGLPRVDKHIYARENGWAITGIIALYDATGEQKYLDAATRAAKWIIQNRSLPGGGFRHDNVDAAGPYLGDTLAMSRAFLALYGATGDRTWLRRAESGVHFITENFADANGAGFLTTKIPTDQAYAPHQQRDENVTMVRVASLLFHYTGNSTYRKTANTAMRYLSAADIAENIPVASVLLADRDITRPPLHLTVVGHKDDPTARALFQAALRYPSTHKRLEWWDAREGKLPNPDVQYPQLAKAALFVCTARTCSSPIYSPDQVQLDVDKLMSVNKQIVAGK